jgi:hypothetical protein
MNPFGESPTCHYDFNCERALNTLCGQLPFQDKVIVDRFAHPPHPNFFLVCETTRET